MTKAFLFLSDFDGTLTGKDFFHVIIDQYFQKDSEQLYADWDSKVTTDLNFLTRLFGAINRDQAGIEEDILKIPFDPDAKKVIEHVQRAGGDFVVISAGTDYYIKRIFSHYGVHGVKIYSNPGIYANRGIQLKVDPNGRYYSEMYGIDKAKLARDLIRDYDTVYFAGDSRPDLQAAELADTAFAKGKLQGLLDAGHHPYVPIRSFKDVEDYLLDHEEVLNNGSR
ncbi:MULTISPECIES: MtnX-like HAD-IB family phosphatase [unclassified Sporolactobacillus]|uniref:MtnX-like HAD-IB family phosphatase n=1 Tax=unclassified Sporolactobacillus TaxID=2628533 RepID=UPI002367659B|nr:MtnX-like HAD-IB family phosphatase [Sporolactobacillus sp. CQH2019]MDD9147968.1 MtnX-like HAD-IB family phosphatase [Sporolactobacillus sp. CQH2019]